MCAAQEAYKAIAASQREGAAAAEEGGPEARWDYTEYYRPEVLEAGIRAGKLVPGLLRVNKHLSQQEAFVTPRTATDARFEFFGDQISIKTLNPECRLFLKIYQ